MKIGFSRILIATSMILVSFAVNAQDDNPFIGTWDLDKAASNFGSAPVPESMTRTYQSLGDGRWMFLLVTINQDGNVGGSSAAYRYDRQENPLASLGQTVPTTISYRRENEKTVEYTVRLGGRVAQIGAKTISPGGRVLTIAIQFLDAQGQITNTQILSFNRRR